MLTLPITKQAKQQEWQIVLTTAQNNGFTEYIIHKLTKKLTSRKYMKNPNTTEQEMGNIHILQSTKTGSRQPL